MVIKELGSDIVEFSRSVGWYSHKKVAIFGLYFETGKSLVVEVLKARRGTYQKPFLHAGMVLLIATAVLSTPIIVNQYPTAAAANTLAASISPSAVLNAATDISSVETETRESVKPRRDVEEYEVKGGDTLSSIAKKYDVDVDSLAYLNNMTVNKLLQPGDIIKIPPVSGVVVTVRSGDTISTLAKKYNLASAQPIVDWPYNTFVNDETFSLAAGQTLVIPGGTPPEEAPVIPKSVRTQSLFAGGTGQFLWPTNGILTQYFSWYHPADDIANSIGTPVVAADSGRVVTVAYEGYGYGNHIIIDHGNGYQTLYGHLSRINVGEGDNVGRGQQIGLMGSTGRSTGPHLHFEISQNGGRVNPLSFLK